MYIRDVDSLRSACAAFERAGVLAIDTEFMREKTYYARLCLIQVATEEQVYLIDAPALERDLGLLAPALMDPGIVKIVHAGTQDVEVLLRATGTAPSPLFDTQIAATLAGFPTQVGYAQLVKDMLDVTVDKGDTFTDWAARPLTDAQLAYAAADVEFLPTIYTRLREELDRGGRLAWLAEDFARLADPETYRVDPREQYRRVKRASTLDRRSLAVLREITAWRELEAQRKDLPRRWVVGDESLVEIARRRPKTTAELASVRGVGDRLGGQRASGILSAVAAGLAVPDDDLPRMAKRQRTGADVGPIADLLSAVCRLRAREHGVAITLLATREDLERFATGDREGHPLAEGWRHTIVGADLETVLDGRAALRVRRGRVELTALESGAAASDDDDA